MDTKTWLEEYLLALKAERRAPNTVQWYKQNLEPFLFLLTSEEKAISPRMIREYLIRLGDSGVSPSTVHGAYRSIRAFFNFLEREEILRENPVAKVRPPKMPRTLVKPLSEKEMRTFLEAATAIRDQAIVILMLDTGLRASEVTSLQLDDVDFQAGRAKIKGKGAKERFVPLGFKTRRALLKYINRYRLENILHGEVFLTKQGNPMRRNCLTLLFRRLSKRAGLSCSPHKLRHTFAVFYLRNGGDIFTLQSILGHSSLEMVRRYAYLADGDVQRAHERASPMDRL